MVAEVVDFFFDFVPYLLARHADKVDIQKIFLLATVVNNVFVYECWRSRLPSRHNITYTMRRVWKTLLGNHAEDKLHNDELLRATVSHGALLFLVQICSKKAMACREMALRDTHHCLTKPKSDLPAMLSKLDTQ